MEEENLLAISDALGTFIMQVVHCGYERFYMARSLLMFSSKFEHLICLLDCT